MRGILSDFLARLQKLGGALMLPIAVLPAAGILLRLGQPDMLDIAFVAAAGDALFSNLGLLFAVGVAVGIARGGHGAAGLAGASCYLVATAGAAVFVEVPSETLETAPQHLFLLLTSDYQENLIARVSVPIGIISGVCAGLLFNRFSGITFPQYLAFFGGKRFVPIAASLCGMLLAAIIGASIESIVAAIAWLSDQVTEAGSVGLFVYGALNRLLLVTGLHHILNNMAWFVLGEYGGVTGDLNRFFAGDPSAGEFMAGYFPVMMFGLPGACLAMYHATPIERRAENGGLYGSMGLTSFLTGVTEPIEFAFIFKAPQLFVIHALLTGISMVVMDALGVRLGFGFSAGLFDYVINYRASSLPLLLLPVGLAYFLIYYLIFRVMIVQLDRSSRDEQIGQPTVMAKGRGGSDDDKVSIICAALGGSENIREVGACTTRLRLQIADTSLIDEALLISVGAKGLMKLSAHSVQVVIGLDAERYSDELRELVDASQQSPSTKRNGKGRKIAVDRLDPDIAHALGGIRNIGEAVLVSGNRLQIVVIDGGRIAFDELEARGLLLFGGDRVDGKSRFMHFLCASSAALENLDLAARSP